MALPFHLPLSRFHSARPSSTSCSPHALNMFAKAHCWQSPPSRSHRLSAYVMIGVKDETASRQVKIHCIAQEEGRYEGSRIVKDKSVSVVLLAGGKGKRMGVSIPKQYLPLLGKPIALYSFYTFSELSEVKEIVVVCDPSYKDVFEDACEEIQVNIKFALPGKERQDSVFSGFQEIDESSELVCIHDSARPLVSCEDIKKVLKDGWVNGAAVLGVPVKATIKEANNDFFVVRTLDRKNLWEMQTPQVIKNSLLRAGFELVNRYPEISYAKVKYQYTHMFARSLASIMMVTFPSHSFGILLNIFLTSSMLVNIFPSEGLEVTDDVSIVEHLNHPVFITEGSYTNIKVTTTDDLLLAERILNMET